MSEDSPPGSGPESRSAGAVVAIARSPGFWPLMRYAVVLAFAALAFLALVMEKVSRKVPPRDAVMTIRPALVGASMIVFYSSSV